MRGKIFIRTLCCLFVATATCGTLMAQGGRTVQGSGKIVLMPHSSVVIPYRDDDSPDASVVFAKNLGPAGNTYATDNGWLVTGPSDVTFGGPDSLGVKFTPSVSGHATKLSAAIGYIEGTKKVRLGIYSESTTTPGAVGTLILDASTTAIPNFGVCCTLTKVTLPAPGAALIAGTHYFLVATSDASATDFGGAWAFVPPAGSATGAGFGQSFNNSGTGGVYDAEWTYYAAYEVQGTSP
jgi:hypothetical protein